MNDGPCPECRVPRVSALLATRWPIANDQSDHFVLPDSINTISLSILWEHAERERERERETWLEASPDRLWLIDPAMLR